jgi:hypothetical protein
LQGEDTFDDRHQLALLALFLPFYQKPICSAEPSIFRSQRVSGALREPVILLPPIVLFVVLPYVHFHPKNRVEFWPVKVHVSVEKASERSHSLGLFRSLPTRIAGL